MIYPNSYIRDLAEAEKRMSRPSDSPTRDRRDGFVEIPIEQDPRREDRDQAEVCSLSCRQLQDLQAVIAEVVEITPDTNYIKILLPDGKTETAYCNYSGRLKIGDELYITARERGRQKILTIHGLVPPDRKRGST